MVAMDDSNRHISSSLSILGLVFGHVSSILEVPITLGSHDHRDVATAVVFVTDRNANSIGGYFGSKGELFQGYELFLSQKNHTDSRVFSPPSGYYLHPCDYIW